MFCNTVFLILRDEHRSGMFVKRTMSRKVGLKERGSKVREGKMFKEELQTLFGPESHCKMEDCKGELCLRILSE